MTHNGTPIILTRKDGTQKTIWVKNKEQALELMRISQRAKELLPDVLNLMKEIDQILEIPVKLDK